MAPAAREPHVAILRPTVNGAPVDRVWTLVAEEVNGVLVRGRHGTRELEREAWFAWRADATAYANDLRAEGFEVDAPCPLAANYHGPTDSPSNAWSVRGRRPFEHSFGDHAAGVAARLEQRAAALRRDGDSRCAEDLEAAAADWREAGQWAELAEVRIRYAT